MGRNNFVEVDNRNSEHMFEYLEARIEFMKRRILELQVENEALRDIQLNAQLINDATASNALRGMATSG